MIDRALEVQHTFAPHGHVLTNVGVWSPDSKWIVYDVRSDPAGAVFDGQRIERVHVETGEVQVLYQSSRGACCGVATYHPAADKVVFIHGPEDPTPDWQYCAYHRRGVIVDVERPDIATTLDACDITPPFTPGALRGGTHVHTFNRDGWVAFTYEDHVLAQSHEDVLAREGNQRNLGISAPYAPVTVSRAHHRNHDGSHFSVLVTRTHDRPRPGSDEISKACEEGWLGEGGYLQSDGSWQRRALAFQGTVIASSGEFVQEVLVVDLPDNISTAGTSGPLSGTTTTRPHPPQGTTQRRLTFTTDRKYPGIQGPRHWLRSSSDGEQIAFLMRDNAGIVQLFTVSPRGGPIRQISHYEESVSSAFTWSLDGRSIAHVLGASVVVIEVATGEYRRLTDVGVQAISPRPEACVFSPDGQRVAYVRPVEQHGQRWNQVFTVRVGSHSKKKNQI